MGRRHRIRAIALALALDLAFLLAVGVVEGAGYISERFSGALAGAFSIGNILLVLRWAFDDDDDRPSRGGGSATAGTVPLERGAQRSPGLADFSALACLAAEVSQAVVAALRSPAGPRFAHPKGP
jgi:hypothetical protein